MATVLGLLAAVVVLFVAAVVATREGPVMAEAVPDAPDTGMPAGRVTGADVRQLLFPRAARGYRADDVDDALEQVAAALDERDARIAELEAALHDTAPEPPGAGPAGER